MIALVITPTSAELLDAPSRPDAVALRWCQEQVGGWIEAIYPARSSELRGWVAYVNEEGKLHQLPINEPATDLALRAGWLSGGDVLVGPAVFLGMSGENTTDVPEALVKLAGLESARSPEK